MNAVDAIELAGVFGADVTEARAEPLTGGYSNESWHVRGRGDGTVVRAYGRMHLTHETVAFEHAVMDHAARRMPEIAPPLRDAAGASIRLHAGRYVAAFPFVRGSTGARDAAAGSAAAALLGRFHRASRSLHLRGGLRSTRFLGIMPLLMDQYRRFADKDSPVARALPWADLLVAVSGSIARLAPTATLLPNVIVHGDPHPGNVVSDDGHVRALIDFDFTHESERITDVGALLDEFARDDDDGPLQLDRVPGVLAAYHAVAPLTAAERALLADAMLRHAATLVSYVVTRHGERVPGDVGGAPKYAARVLEIARSAGAIRTLAEQRSGA